MEFLDSVRKDHECLVHPCFLGFAVNHARVEAQRKQHCCHMSVREYFGQVSAADICQDARHRRRVCNMVAGPCLSSNRGGFACVSLEAIEGKEEKVIWVHFIVTQWFVRHLSSS